MATTVTIEFNEDQTAELSRMAREAGLSVEDVVRGAVDLLALGQAAADAPPLTPEERAKIEQGLRDVREGRVVPHDDVMKSLRERYGL